MNTSNCGIKKPAFCRYFLSSGSCFYGNECSFVHAVPNNASAVLSSKDVVNSRDLSATDHETIENLVGQSMLDYYLPFSQQNGILPDSKLSTYINRPAGGSSSGSSRSDSVSLTSGLVDKHNVFSSVGNLANSLVSLTLDSAPNPSANEFIPRSSTPGGISSSGVATSSSFLGFESSQSSIVDTAIPFTSSSRQARHIAASAWGSEVHDGLNHHVVAPLSATTSPLNSPHLTPQSSPLLKRRNHSPPIPYNNPDSFISNTLPTFQKNVDGTTYFYSADSTAPPVTESPAAVLPNYVMYPCAPAHLSHMKPKANAPSFFMPDELRLDIIHRHNLTMAQISSEQYPDIPVEIDNYHNLYPLDPHPTSHLDKSATFGYAASVYKATNIKTGLVYCLRRIHGFRILYPKVMTLVDMWKKLQHSNLVHLREVFTTKAFGEHSSVFVYDYHPGAETLMSKHFANSPHLNGLSPGIFRTESSRPFLQSGVGEPRQHAGLLPESLIWAYVVQLCSVMRTIHAAGLACRTLDPTKILITGKSRIRLNCCGIYDVITFDPNQSNPLALMPHYQQEDLISLGKVVLALACNSLGGIQRENLTASMELVARNYSADLRNLIVYLLTNQNRVRSVNDIMPMIGARFFTQLDAAHMRSDVIENELAKEVECSRLFRLLAKLGTINERPEFHMHPSWSETGDRYMLKLFRDYLFHQVHEDGRPWLDLAHVVQCLNKLDAGVPEKICLMSRDEQNVLVVSYAELKQCFEASFNEILQAASESKEEAAA